MALVSSCHPIWLSLFVCIVVAGSTLPAQSQIKVTKDPLAYIIDQLFPPVPRFKTPPGYKFSIGAVAGFVPAFEGSSDYRFRYSPLIDITYRDRAFLNSNRLRVNFLPSGNIRGGFQLQYLPGRKEQRSESLKGLGDVGWSLQAGVYVEAHFFRGTVISGNITRDIAHGHTNWLASFLLGQGLYQDDNTVLGVGLQTDWASKDYMNAYFGINAAQSAASGLPIFTAHSGFKDIGLLLYGSQDLNRHISLVGNVTLRYMLDSAKDSPIVIQRGNPKQLISGVALQYAF